MKVQDARKIGEQLAEQISKGQARKAAILLAPILSERTPFRLLDEIGTQIGENSIYALDDFFEEIAAQRTMGGWVVIASALRKQLTEDLPSTFKRCREFVLTADVWYATDTFGERIPGPALVANFEPSLALLAPWREDSNCWIRRIVGVAVHFWAKHARGTERYLPHVRTLLDFLVPMFTECDRNVIKGVGWGLKTLGKHYPDLVADWLEKQVERPHKALMMRKAITYLPPEIRQRIK